MRLSFAAILFCLFLSLGHGYAGTEILHPHRSENDLVMHGALDQDLLAKLVLEETNRFRASQGRGSLEIFLPLMTAAQDHADAMAEGHFFAHRNPYDKTQQTLSDRIHRVSLEPRAYAENIALTYSIDFREMLTWVKKGRKTRCPSTPEHTYRSLAEAVTQQWINSPSHRRNMLGNSFTLIGLGFATAWDTRGYYKVLCVQTFSVPDLPLSGGR